MIKNNKQLIQALDNHLAYLGYTLQVTSKPTKRQESIINLYDSIKEAMDDLNLKGKTIAHIIRSLTGEKEFVYGYNWQFKKVKI